MTARTFLKDDVPCILHSDVSFVYVLLSSIFLGILGIDRFILGHVGIGVAKLLTIGGLGVWWIVDIILLVAGELSPDVGWSHTV
jgi:TM2 domain-containing membrane protein YozV